MKEYRIRKNYPAPIEPDYLSPSYNSREKAEQALVNIKNEENDSEVWFEVVYGTHYENGGFAEFKE